MFLPILTAAAFNDRYFALGLFVISPSDKAGRLHRVDGFRLSVDSLLLGCFAITSRLVNCFVRPLGAILVGVCGGNRLRRRCVGLVL